MRTRIAGIFLAGVTLAGCSPTPTDLPTGSSHRVVFAGISANQPDRYIVVYKATVPDARAEIARDVSPTEARVERVYQHALRGWSGELTPNELQRLRREPHVAFIEKDTILSISTSQTPTPSWGLDRIDQRTLPGNSTYSYSQTGAGVHFYGIDTGILYSHVDFGGRASPGYDAITSGGGAVDCNGHGTHTASTAAGATYGVAKGMTVVGVRVLDCSGSGSISQVIAGVDWVTQHAIKPAVANMSLGGGLSAALDQAVAASIASGVVYAIAAGNSATDACLGSPADVSTALTVNASDINDTRASFSNYGTCTDLFAPGVNITAAWAGSNTDFITISGTSMATPHVAGAAGLYLEANPSATPAQVATALLSNATSNVIIAPGTGSPNRLLYTGFIGVVTPPNQPPVASFSWNCTGLNTNQCALNASASTDDVGIVSYAWNWGNGRGETKTVPTTKNTWAAPGTYNVTLTVTDGGGLSNAITLPVVVGTAVNQLPTASITAPANNTLFVQGSSVQFNGSGSDPEDGVLTGASLVWTSNIDGQIGTGTSFSKSNLSLGTHTITLTARDAQNATGTATRTITITAPVNQLPTASITAPANNTSFVQGSSVQFSGSGSDPEDGVLTGASLVWTSSIDGQIGTGTSFSKSNLSLGTHTITLTARDAQNATGTATRTITITAPVNQLPTASITAPANNTSFVQGSGVQFTGSGSDPEDGVLTGASLVWTSSIDGQIGTGTSFSKSNLSLGTHTITLTARDAQNATGTATRTITITAPGNQPPVANFTWNCTGLNLHQCAMDATSSTDDAGIVLYSWNWGNGRSESKTVPIAKNTWATSGSFVVTLTVTDAGGLTSSVAKTVIVP